MSQYIVQSKARGNKTAVAKAVKTAVGIQHQEISEGSRELAQYVRDLYASGAKLWTKDMFRDIEAELAKEPKPHAVMIRSSTHIPGLFVALSTLFDPNNSRYCSEWGAKA
jgi:hypothetical protein